MKMTHIQERKRITIKVPPLAQQGVYFMERTQFLYIEPAPTKRDLMMRWVVVATIVTAMTLIQYQT